MKNLEKQQCLHDELDIAYKLIVAGLGELQEIEIVSNYYHLSQQLLASGIERLLKCYICLIYEARNGAFPNKKYIKNIKHDLTHLTQIICTDYFNHNDIPALISDQEFLTRDVLLKQIIHILSEFGKLARYYNLDVVTGSKSLPIDPMKEWEQMKQNITKALPHKSFEDNESYYNDFYPWVHSQIVLIIERFVRAIARQFTLGKHGGKLSQFSLVLFPFLTIMDPNLGTKDYRRSMAKFQEKKDCWIKRSEEEICNGRWPTKCISKRDFAEEWPFRTDRVIIECRDSIFCIVNIEGYAFGLNGSALSRFGYPDPHDAGVAILGKSYSTFVNMAFELSKRKEPDK